MDNVHELLSIRERSQRVRDLRREFGDAAIPKDMLSALGFTYSESEDGVSTFTPVERVESRRLEETERPEGTLPRTLLRLEIPTNESVGVRVSAAELRKRLVQFSDEIFANAQIGTSDVTTASEDIVNRVYGPDSALAELQRAYPHLLQQDPDKDIVKQRESGDRDYIALEYVLDELTAGHGLNDAGFDDYAREASLAAYTRSRVSDELTHSILGGLQKLRGKLADVDEIERYFVQDMSLHFNADPRFNDWTPAEDGDINHQARYFADILADAGFHEAAVAMRSVHTVDEARQLIEATLRHNEHKTEAKRLETSWQQKRRQTVDEAEIHRLSAERAANDEAYRRVIRTVRGLQELLDFPSRYAGANLRSIKKMEEILLTKAAAEPIELVLDTRPDAKRDANPGEVSGDCTEDRPLLFGRKSGMHNVKAILDDEHIGNLYLLETESTDGESVWHIDAIQIPVRQIDWKAFPKHLIDSLRPLAEQHGVTGITLNQTQYLVSNYDYVSKGFMEYFGRGDGWREHDSMQQPDDAGMLSDEPDRTCRVSFDRYEQAAHGIGCSLPQGREDSQIYLWRGTGVQTVD